MTAALRAALDAQVALVSNLRPHLSTADATAIRVGWDTVYAAVAALNAAPVMIDLTDDAQPRRFAGVAS